MLLNISKSLSRRILTYFFIVSISLILLIFYTFEAVGKEAFKSLEKSKAEVVIDTIIPTVSMDLYLGMDDQAKQLIENILKANKNILGITLIHNKKVVATYMKQNIRNKDYFVFTKTITKPNSKEKIGNIYVVYSYEHYEEIIDKYKKILLMFLGGIALLLFLFSVYLEQLLSPFKAIVAALADYSPKKDLHFPDFIHREDEIGSIARVLESMQNRIKKYALKQENMNKILEEKVQEKTKELRNRLYIDSLTGLANRLKLQEDLSQLPHASIVIINIDSFKEINDLFGHKIGDKILKDFAVKLKNLINTNNPRLYRLGGDEFALLFHNKMSRDDIKLFLDSLTKNIEKMVFVHGDKELSLHVSMGAAAGEKGILEKADIALKKAKKARRVYAIYEYDDAKVEKEYEKNIEWIKKLKRSIELDRVVPFFQPIVNTQTRKPKGYECLIRIIDDNGSVVSPGVFLEIAKKSRYYNRLTGIMIEKSCQYFSQSTCSFSINLSILDILDPNIVAHLKESIQKYEVENKIILEIVESEGIENYELVYNFFTEMKEIGCQIAIDDFGTGYSNFEHILKLPIDYIKIDGSLIENICENEDSELIVSTIVDFAHKKGIKTVSEYVSNKEIFEKIRSLGVDYAQGFYFDKPKQYVEKDCDI
ncbi:bifunctional diguanylate cyclase/phosphodiesterase [Nitratiruptor tergarcus]|uniref:Diguanylate cyclase (GGDEF) domain-containing protein n=1 Tax=Nitratiruptor tergarcus DSM 16512 TaxID=1069081 RepID=A0A1W1WTD1_9BACT|nr:bifunctional diguanylate cyclase/phosphodiesterase [Nitratiruptor tergarcus]SMC09459.1 diguanylate cyclase (GGDEF) domain-containing protein [Nitratiruptor tergarcus DSM 16512]